MCSPPFIKADSCRHLIASIEICASADQSLWQIYKGLWMQAFLFSNLIDPAVLLFQEELIKTSVMLS